MSFRARLTLTSMLTLAVGLAALLAAGNVVLDRRVGVEASSLLNGRAEALIAAVEVGTEDVTVRETPNDAELDQRSWVLDGARVIERPPGVTPALDRIAVALGRSGRAGERAGPGDTRLLSEPLRATGGERRGAVVVAVSTAPLERLQQEVLVGSLILAALVLLAGWLAIRGAIGGALRPIARMTESAEDWGEHDLERRFDLGPPRDELTGLAATLDHLLARIAASRRHEQRLASELAHELRTPLARMRGRAELALAADDTQARTDALSGVVEQSARLDRSIDALLAVARYELDPTAGAVDLAALVAELDDVELVIAGDLPLAEGEPEIVRRALAPLVENARRHARSVVTVELAAAGSRVRATVRDDGPGVDATAVERVFEPGVRGAGASPDGAGLGLSLARRLARSCGGEVTARPGPGGCFVLDLPAVR